MIKKLNFTPVIARKMVNPIMMAGDDFESQENIYLNLFNFYKMVNSSEKVYEVLKEMNPKVICPLNVQQVYKMFGVNLDPDCSFRFVFTEDEVKKYLAKHPFNYKLFEKKTSETMDYVKMVKGLNDAVLDICNKLETIQNKINLLYVIYNDIDLNHVPEDDLHSVYLAKLYFLSRFEKIKDLKTEDERNAYFEKVMKDLFIDLSTLIKNVNSVLDLGQIKFSKKVSVPVLLSNGNLLDLLDLDLKMPAIISHDIDISKIKTSLDLSNISVDGSFKCVKAKAFIKLPEYVKGELDCSDCFGYVFVNDVYVPDGVSILKCERTINNFETLLKIDCPNSLKTIVVASNVIKSVAKDSNSLMLAKQFLEKYPNIELISKDISLKDMLKNLEKNSVQNIVPTEKINAEIKVVKPVIAEKTKDWLTRNELVSSVKQDNRIPKMSDDELKRLIVRALKQLNILEEDRLSNGVVVKCVNKECAVNIEDTILKILVRDAAQSIKSESTDVEVSVESEMQQKITTQEQIKPIKIKKYIHKNIWKQISKISKGNNQTLLNVLNEINCLNMDITKQTKQGAVQYINENAQIAVSKTVKKESGCCLVQSVDGVLSSDRKRIVWTFNASDNIVVACGCFDEHQGTARISNSYNEALTMASKCQFSDGTDIALKNINLNEFYDIDELVKRFSISPKMEKFLSQKLGRKL